MEDYSQPTEDSFCAQCFKTAPKESLRRCGRCKAVFYCSPGPCQTKNWPWHKPSCILTSTTTTCISSSSIPRQTRVRRFLSWSRSQNVNDALSVAGISASLHGDPKPKFLNEGIVVLVKESNVNTSSWSLIPKYDVISTAVLPFSRISKSLSPSSTAKEQELLSVLKNIVNRDSELGSKNEWWVAVTILVNDQRKIVTGNLAPMCKPRGKDWIKELNGGEKSFKEKWKDELKRALIQS